MKNGGVFQIVEMVYLDLHPYWQNSVSKQTSQKLSPKYFGPYKIIEKVGSAAYRLQLPPDTLIHGTSHVSQLIKAVGSHQVQANIPLHMNDLVEAFEPYAVLERQMVKRGNQAAVQLLIHWKEANPSRPTWEWTNKLQLHLPQFTFKDKGSKWGGNDMEANVLKMKDETQERLHLQIRPSTSHCKTCDHQNSNGLCNRCS